MTPPTVNAYYDPQMNDINFPAGVLQPPLFDPKLDDAPNYGNTGGDHRPRADARLRRRRPPVRRQGQPEGLVDARRTPTSSRSARNCVRDQYAQYTIVDDIKINGKLTQRRGRRRPRRHAAGVHRVEGRRRRARSCEPVDGFTPDQRFFIGIAQWACENERPENLRVNAITNPHSPGKYRINGVVANMPEFAEGLLRARPASRWCAPTPARSGSRAMPPTIEAIAPGFFVADLARSVDWYERVLGFHVAFQGADYAGVRLGPALIILGQAGPGTTSGQAACHLRLTSGVDDYAAQIEAAGQPLTAAPKDRPEYGLREAAVRDPDGHAIYIAQELMLLA